jgi:DNA repair exonuclease SbcCD nuclease subunit
MKTTIFHTADLHIKNSRREEYADVFAKFILNVRKNTSNCKIVVLAGDIFDNKTTISAANMLDYAAFISSLTEVCDIIITIMGNHDVNLNNPESIDLVYPFHKIMNNNKVFHYHKSGSYIHENIVFNVQSPSDPVILPHVPERFNILLFHENVDGVKFSGDMELKGRFSIADLKKYDAVMGGHIHEYTKIGSNGAYCGALIQQNQGESITKGYIEWSICDSEGSLNGQNGKLDKIAASSALAERPEEAQPTTGARSATMHAVHKFIPIHNVHGYLKYTIRGSVVSQNVIAGYNSSVEKPYKVVIFFKIEFKM